MSDVDSLMSANRAELTCVASRAPSVGSTENGEGSQLTVVTLSEDRIVEVHIPLELELLQRRDLVLGRARRGLVLLERHSGSQILGRRT